MENILETKDCKKIAAYVYQEVKRIIWPYKKGRRVLFRNFLLIWCEVDNTGWQEQDKVRGLLLLSSLLNEASIVERQCEQKGCLREWFLLRCQLASIIYQIRGRQRAMLGGRNLSLR